MPAGTRIERLYLSLGLDISEFDSDLAGAQTHVRQAASQLGRDLRMQRLRMEIDLAGIDNAENSVRGLDVRLGHLRTQMQTQRSSVDLLNHAYNESVRLLGANAAASRNLQERLTREQLAEPYQVTEEELTQLETIFDQLQINNQKLQDDLKQSKADLMTVQTELTVLKSQLQMLKLESTVAKSELLTANNSLRMVNKSLKTYESEVKAETRKLKFERDIGYLVAVVMLLKNKKYAV